jgi:hypothetical protein
MSNAELALSAQVVLGIIMQYARSMKNWPNWLIYLVIAIAAAGCFVWATPDFSTRLHADWRTLGAMALSFFLATRGSAATAKDAKAAPPTNVN